MSRNQRGTVPILPTDSGPVPHAKQTCANCMLRSLCLPGGIPPEQLDELDELVAARRRVPRGAVLQRAGDEFRSFHAVRRGSFKTRVTHAQGRTQIVGFPLAGELLGLEAVALERYSADAIALEDSEVCVLPYHEVERIAREFAPLQHRLHQIMSREIVREQGMMMMLFGLSAEQRVASFIIHLCERYQQIGYSPTAVVLRMTREDIGNYLGIKIETVSRAFSKLGEQGLLSVHGKQVEILDSTALRERAGGADCSSCATGV